MAAMGTHPLTAYRNRQSPPLTKAALARELSVSKTTVARWEEGVRKIDADLVPRVAEKTGIPARELRSDLAKVFADEVAS